VKDEWLEVIFEQREEYNGPWEGGSVPHLQTLDIERRSCAKPLNVKPLSSLSQVLGGQENPRTQFTTALSSAQDFRKWR
jgi:hypothetical protein